MSLDRGLRRSIATCLVLATTALAADATAQTWAGGTITPSGLDLVAVDATGELLWPHGAEDVAGDGDTFEQPERAIDVRTAYARADGQRLWARLYVSDTAAPAANVIGFVFIDRDQNAATGGPASATDVHPGLTTDPTGGGWDTVLVIPASATAPSVWTWNEGPDRWDAVNPQATQVAGEVGTDFDPIAIGLDDSHGYLQASAEHGLIGITEACAARLFVRTVRDGPEGGGDLDVGGAVTCVPADADGDGVPDSAVPATCDADDDCPFEAICQDGRCMGTELCRTAADCDASEDCSADGRCVARPGGACEEDSTCDTLLCRDGTCAGCTPGGTECGAGRRCGADGRCVEGDDPGTGVGTGAGGSSGVGLGPGEAVQGGACACEVIGAPSRGPSPTGGAAVAALALALVSARRRTGGRR